MNVVPTHRNHAQAATSKIQNATVLKGIIRVGASLVQ